MKRNYKFYEEKRRRKFIKTENENYDARKIFQLQEYEIDVLGVVVNEKLFPSTIIEIGEYLASNLHVQECYWKYDYKHGTDDVLYKVDKYFDRPLDFIEKQGFKVSNTFNFDYLKENYSEFYETYFREVYQRKLFTEEMELVVKMNFPLNWFKLGIVKKKSVKSFYEPIRIKANKFKKRGLAHVYEKQFGAIRDYCWTYPKYGRNKKAKKLNRVKDNNYMAKEDSDWDKGEFYYWNLNEKWNKQEADNKYHYWMEYKENNKCS